MIMYTQDGDSKYVANILSNMANGGDRSVQVSVSFLSSFCVINYFPPEIDMCGCSFLIPSFLRL